MKKLEAGGAVSKFQEESDQIGRRVEAVILGTCLGSETADFLPLYTALLCTKGTDNNQPSHLFTDHLPLHPLQLKERCAMHSSLLPPASWSWVWGQAEHAPNRWTVGWKVRDPITEVRRSPGSVWPQRL